MPATYTHAVYGEMVLEALDEKTRALIEKHRDCYDIGLSGPDILFFYQPLKDNPVKAHGYQMHEEAARPFFEGSRKTILQSKDSEAALVYILGFINHFVLDSQCHPLINRISRETWISHSELESELDALLMRERGLDPIKTKVTLHLHPDQHNCAVIAPFFNVTEKEIKSALVSMKRFLNLFVAPSSLKRQIIFTGMKLAKVYDGLHGLVFNREPLAEYAETCQTLKRLITEAVPVSVSLMEEYLAKLETSAALNERYDSNYE